jgi:cyclophilin family peptidyl-prolyl cis-trans isomerase
MSFKLRLISWALILGLLAPAYAQDLSSETIAPQDTAPKVLIETNYGSITLALKPDKAPVTVENFLTYVDEGFYDGTVFHRVIPNFMVQGGGFTESLEQKPTRDPIVNESDNRLHNVRGTVAMARTNDPDSASAQFFINQRSNLRLDWAPGRPGYTVFAEVVDGMSVVDFISTAETHTTMAMTSRGEAPFSDVPVEPVIIKSIRRVKSP